MKIKCFLQTSILFLVKLSAFFRNIWPLGRTSISFSFVSKQMSIVKRRQNVHWHNYQLFGYNVAVSEVQGSVIYASLQTRALLITSYTRLGIRFTCGCTLLSVVMTRLGGYIFSSTTSGNDRKRWVFSLLPLNLEMWLLFLEEGINNERSDFFII